MNLSTKAQAINADLIGVAAELAPWLGPVPTAWTIGEAVVARFHWPLPIAGITGLAIELVGLTASNTALMLFSYQIGKRKIDPPVWAQFSIATAGVIVYFILAVALTVVLDGGWIRAGFPLLSLVSTINMALKLDHANRLAGIAQAKADDTAKRVKAKQEHDGTKDNPKVSHFGIHGTYEEFHLAQLARNGQGPMGYRDVMKTFHVPRTTAYNWLRKYKDVKNG